MTPLVLASSLANFLGFLLVRRHSDTAIQYTLGSERTPALQMAVSIGHAHPIHQV